MGARPIMASRIATDVAAGYAPGPCGEREQHPVIRLPMLLTSRPVPDGAEWTLEVKWCRAQLRHWPMQSSTSTRVVFEALAPPVGSVDVTTPPGFCVATVATQSETEGHDTARALSPPEPTRALLQALGPPLGSLDVNIMGPSPTATHSVTDAHDTLSRTPLPAVLVLLRALSPPVGSLDTKILPAPSAATHIETDGHETPTIP